MKKSLLKRFNTRGMVSWIGVVLIMAFSPEIRGQSLLSPDRAVEILLANNFGILVASKNIDIAENNTRKENLGYYPTLNLSAGPTASFGGSTQNFNNNFGSASVNAAFSWGVGASVGANYTLLDRNREATLSQLKEIVNLTDLELRFQIENNVSLLLTAYYELARLYKNVTLQEETINLSIKRLDQASTRFSYGQGSRLDVLNAEVDLQRDSINYISLIQAVKNAKRNLNFIMGQPVSEQFDVDTSLTINSLLSLDELIVKGHSDNIQLMLNDKNADITRLNFDIIDATAKPTVGAGASFDVNYQDNAPGSFINTSNSRALNLGITLNWNILDGGLRKVRKENNQLELEAIDIQRDQLMAEIERDIVNAWEEYRTALFILEAERANLATNRENYERTDELFRVGQVTSVEYRQAQLNLLTAATSLTSAEYDLKLIEIRLVQLSGDLLASGF